MKAIQVIPLQANSLHIADVPEPIKQPNETLVKTKAVGICGTDLEIAAGKYGWAPALKQSLIIGHEAIGQIIEDVPGYDLKKNDWVVPIVRQPDPEPCYSCANEQWDMCKNGRYKEHGIKELDGFMSELFCIDPKFLVKVDQNLKELNVLLEPTSVVAKAWEQVELIGNRALWQPKKACITGAGPIGLLAAMIGIQKGLEVNVVDIIDKGLKPTVVKELGATYYCDDLEQAAKGVDCIIECSGAPQIVLKALELVGPSGVVCLTGVSSGGISLSLDAGDLNRYIVLENEAIVGSVNANKKHYGQASEYLSKADPNWLEQLITRRVKPANFKEAFEHSHDDVKVIIDFA
jgi:threonine dehydrogenase-like Zn-dependent dehydrogenase